MTQHGIRPSILVVDDEPQMLRSLEGLLEDDFEVIASTDSQGALKLLENQEISVIIVDQRMPGLSGDEFLSEASDRSEATRILMSGYADIQALIRAVNQGQIYTFVAKPWEPRHLKMAVLKAAEHWLLNREAVHERTLLSALMNNIPDAIWFEDSMGRFTDVNKAAAFFLGATDPALVIGKGFSHFLNPEDAQRIQTEEERIIRLRRAETNQIGQFHWKDAGTRWMSTTRTPIFEKSGVVTGLVGVSRDITEQKDADLALERSEQRYRQIVETASEGVWILDEQLQTLFVNGKMARMLGCVTDEMMGKPLTDFLMHEDRRQSLDFFEGRSGRQTTADLRLKKKDGSQIWVMISGSPMLDSSGQRSGTLAMLTDVTERKALEEQFRQAQKLEAVGRFAGSVAHDFNNILTLIAGHTQLLLRQLPDENPMRNQVEKIGIAADQAADLTRQLLSIGRRRAFRPEVVDLNVVVTNFEKMCHPIIREDVRLITQLDALGARVRADAGQLDQVLMNLVVNARDAMPEGGTVTIATSHVELNAASDFSGERRAGPYILLTLSDTGTGMDTETQMHAFEPFFTTKEEGRGTGLGLSTVHGIVSQHGGWIEMASELGQGTCFSIYFPRVADEVTATSPSGAPGQQPKGHKTILVVEDQVNLRDIVRQTLESASYKVLEAGTGQAALEICERHPEIALVLTDFILPGLNGREFAKLLRAQHPQVSVLFMSGGDAPGGEAFIQKPFKPKALTQKIQDLLSASSAPLSILVADDDSEIRALLRTVLEESGYRVFTAENGKKAVAILKDTPIHLLLTDLVMPEQEGMETIVQVRKRYPDLQIVAVSGAFAGPILDAASHFGANAILEKPLQIDEVLRVVQTLLGQRS
jgi:two-component system, cell cycle sensor histidine kinase and response regulator CckA